MLSCLVAALSRLVRQLETELRIVAGLAQRNPSEPRPMYSLSRWRRPPCATQVDTSVMPLTHGVKPRCIQTSGSEHSVLQPLYIPLTTGHHARSLQAPVRARVRNLVLLRGASSQLFIHSRVVRATLRRASGTIDCAPQIDHDLLAPAQRTLSTPLGARGGMQSH